MKYFKEIRRIKNINLKYKIGPLLPGDPTSRAEVTIEWVSSLQFRLYLVAHSKILHTMDSWLGIDFG